jgi:hypothetical protein
MDMDPEPNFSKVGTGINSRFFLSVNKQLFNQIHTISVVFVRSLSIFPLPVSSVRKTPHIYRLFLA